MAGKVRHLVNRSGRYHARIVVPKDLRDVIGKTELRTPLGGDYRQALRLLPGAVAQLQHEIAVAERKATSRKSGERPVRFPMAPDQIAWANYQSRIAFDDELRNDPRYVVVEVDDNLARGLRDGMVGRLNDHELDLLVGERIERYRHLGNTDAERGTEEWRSLARTLCASEYEALTRLVERDEGNFSGTPTHPILVNAKPADEPERRISLSKLWDEYVVNRNQAGFMRDGGRRQAPVIKSLRAHLRHDDALRVTKKDLLGWRDFLMATHSAKTVSDVYLATVRTLFRWAVENDRLPENPAATVRQPKPRKVRSRERGFTDDEAEAVLRASLSYEPKADEFGRVREKSHLVAAKRWAPILCAFSGARISEITQLRKEDVRQEGARWVIRIAPEAGTVKTSE